MDVKVTQAEAAAAARKPSDDVAAQAVPVYEVQAVPVYEVYESFPRTGATATTDAPSEPELTAIVKVLREYGHHYVPVDLVARSVGSTPEATLAALRPLVVKKLARLDEANDRVAVALTT
jgi:hypothetical protein